jgi:steroid 5-alpha reductase family enzyme
MEIQVILALTQFASFDSHDLESLCLALYLLLLLSALCLIGSIVTGNYSQVDQLWSIVPPVYALLFVSHARTFSLRELLALGLILVWGARLSYNFYRKGGYSGVEDYRWVEVRKMIPNPVLWQVFNVGFICLYQQFLLLSIALPVYIATLYSSKPLNITDIAAFILCVLSFVLEVTADQQQWAFQTAKYAKISNKEKLEGDYAKGFLTSGLFRYSRHPNYCGEQAIWWGVYLFSVGAAGVWLHWSMIGAAQLTLLFHFSSDFTEKLTKAKYPAYTEYCKTTSRHILWFPSSRKVD